MSTNERDLYVVLGNDRLRLALPAAAVREITAVPPAIPLPAVPSFVVGLTSWRAAPLPVIDLLAAVAPAEGEESPGDDRCRLVVLEIDRVKVGLRVPRVFSVGNLGAATTPKILNHGRLAGLVVGEVQQAGALVGILNGSKLLAVVRP